MHHWLRGWTPSDVSDDVGTDDKLNLEQTEKREKTIQSIGQ